MFRQIFFAFAVLSLAACTSVKKGSYKGHGTESLAKEVLEEFAPKQVDSPNIKKIENILDIRMPSGGVITEDGRRLFFNWNVTGTYQVWRLDSPKGFPIQMTAGEDDSSVQSVSPDGKYIVVRRDEKGKETPGLYWQSVGGGPLQLIFSKDKVQTFYQFITDDSRYIYYRANDVNPKRYNIYRYDMKRKRSELILESGEGYWSITDNLPNGNFIIGNWKGNTSNEFFLFTAKTKKLSPIIGQGEDEEYDVAFSPTDGEYILTSNKIGEFKRLYRLRKGKLTPISPKKNFDIAWFAVDRIGGKVLYQYNEKGYYDFAALSTFTYREKSLRSLANKGALHTYFGRTTRNGRFTTVTIEKHNAPRVSYVYDWSRRVYTQWMLPSHPEVDVSDYVAPTLEYYEDRYGTKIPMFVNRSLKCKQKLCPVVINFHGGPEGQAIPRFSPSIELYLQKGFVYVQPNVRGSRGYGKSWLHSDNGAKRLNVITDIEDVALYIKKNWAVEGKKPKVGVMGGSYGGYSAYMAMTRFGGTFDAGVAVVGMSNLITFLNNTAPYRRHLRTSEYGDPKTDEKALKLLSPINYLDNLQNPLLIVHGANDPRVPAGEAVQIYRKMESKGLDGELVLFADEGHGIRHRKNQAVYMARVLDFFEKHLQMQ